MIRLQSKLILNIIYKSRVRLSDFIVKIIFCVNKIWLLISEDVDRVVLVDFQFEQNNKVKLPERNLRTIQRHLHELLSQVQIILPRKFYEIQHALFYNNSFFLADLLPPEANIFFQIGRFGALVK